MRKREDPSMGMEQLQALQVPNTPTGSEYRQEQWSYQGPVFGTRGSWATQSGKRPGGEGQEYKEGVQTWSKGPSYHMGLDKGEGASLGENMGNLAV